MRTLVIVATVWVASAALTVVYLYRAHSKPLDETDLLLNEVDIALRAQCALLELLT